MHATPGSDAALRAILASIRDARFALGVFCPRCGGRRVQRWGGFRGRRRYRCTSCRRTFSDLTGTPAAYSKKIELWAGYSEALSAGASVRHAAAVLGIQPSTAFRWRHALLDRLRELDTEVLVGWIELGATYFTESQKGARRLERPARRRGLRCGPTSTVLAANVVIACDRAGHAITAVATIATTRRIRTCDLEKALQGRLEGRPTFTAIQGRLGPASIFAHRKRGSYRDARGAGNSRADALAHVRTASAYERNLRAWVLRFRGVATRYLPNYLVWHRAVDVAWRNRFQAVVLRWPFAGEAADSGIDDQYAA